MKLTPALITFRPAVETDVGFILRTWLDSYRDSAFGKQFPIDTYKAIQKEAILRFIGANQVLIACVPDDEDTLIGFICYDNTGTNTMVHYVYVKLVYRNAGVGQMLLKKIQPSTPFICTQVNKRFYELRAVNFLPMMTIREYDDLLNSSSPEDSIQNQCNQWFINHLQEFRDHRSEIMKERNQRAYRRSHSQRIPNSLPPTRGSNLANGPNQEATNATDSQTPQRAPSTVSEPRRDEEQ